MIRPELVARIKELSHLMTREIKVIIQTEFYPISEMTIRKYLDSDRIIKKTCKICKTEYNSPVKVYLCPECASKIKTRDDYAKLYNKNSNSVIKQQMQETIKITQLNETQIKKLLSNYSHTDIRKCYKQGTRIKDLPQYKINKQWIVIN